MPHLIDGDVTLDLTYPELDALHTTLGISIDKTRHKLLSLPSYYRNTEGVAANLTALITLQGKVLQCMAESIADEGVHS